MFSPFRMGPAASGFGLYDIDRGLFRFTWYGITCQKWEILARRKYADITLNNSLWSIGYGYHTVRVRWLPDLYGPPKT